MDVNNLFNAGVFLTIATYLFYQLKSVPAILFEQIKKRVIYTVTVEERSILFAYMEKWLTDNHEKCYKNVKAQIEDEKLKILHFSDIFSIKYNGKRIFINKGREKFENASDIDNAFYNHFKIYGIKAKKHITDLLNEVIAHNKKLEKTEQYIYVNDQGGEWSYLGVIYGKDIDSVILKDKKSIIDDIEDFISKEDWYNKRGIPYKRGFMFYGTPGNGKTSLSLAIAKKFNRNVYLLNLNDIEKDSKLVRAFTRVESNSIIIVEDIDAAFTNRNGNSKISFSCLLNCFDGALSVYGCIIIITTNHVEKIDKALIRNGRIDKKIEIPNPSKELVEEYLSVFYNERIKLSKYNLNIPMSHIQEICLINKDNKDEAIKILSAQRRKNET